MKELAIKHLLNTIQINNVIHFQKDVSQKRKVCISLTATCSSYGSKCVDRVFADDDTYATDEKCQTFLQRCITTEAGFVQRSYDCELDQTSCLALFTGYARRVRCTAKLTNATSLGKI